MSLRHFAATSDHWIARTVRASRRAVMNLQVPAPRVIVRPVLWAFLALRNVYYFIARVFVCEPLFKAYCTSYGRNLHTDVFLHWVQGKGELVVGNDVILDGKSSFHFSARHSHRPSLKIGDRCIIAHGCGFVVASSIAIGNDTWIAAGVRIFDSSGHPTDPDARLAGLPLPPEKVRPVTIGNNVWIGAYATICPGVTLGDGSVIATMSVVTHDVPPNTLVGGNPARPVRSLKPEAVCTATAR